uniref:Uncharacterized protein n=1 Tax=Cacopsylla melanoneura TaxID=428564 RepID=A0A8D8VAH9_9HEMI
MSLHSMEHCWILWKKILFKPRSLSPFKIKLQPINMEREDFMEPLRVDLVQAFVTPLDLLKVGLPVHSNHPGPRKTHLLSLLENPKISWTMRTCPHLVSLPSLFKCLRVLKAKQEKDRKGRGVCREPQYRAFLCCSLCYNRSRTPLEANYSLVWAGNPVKVLDLV